MRRFPAAITTVKLAANLTDMVELSGGWPTGFPSGGEPGARQGAATGAHSHN